MSLKKVSINGQRFQANQTPDTQEDNHNGILGRWNLYEEDDEYCIRPIGRLIQWIDDEYCIVDKDNSSKTYFKHQVIFQ